MSDALLEWQLGDQWRLLLRQQETRRYEPAEYNPLDHVLYPISTTGGRIPSLERMM